MKSNIFRISISFLVSFCLFCCSSSPVDSNNLKSQFVPLKIGNKWKYEYIYYHKKEVVEREIISIDIEHAGFKSFKVITTFHEIDTSYVSDDTLIWWQSDFIFTEYINNEKDKVDTLLHYPLFLNKSWESRNSKFRVINKDSLTVSSGYYEDVWFIQREYIRWENDMVDVYFWKDEIGIIKMNCRRYNPRLGGYYSYEYNLMEYSITD